MTKATKKKIIIRETQLNRVFGKLLIENKIGELRNKYGKKLKDTEIQKLMDADPSPKKSYSDWLCRLYNIAENKERFIEDLYKATELLTVFMRPAVKAAIKRNVRARAVAEGKSPEEVQAAMDKSSDINTYVNIPDLTDVLEPFMEEPEMDETGERRALSKEYITSGDAKLVYEDKEFLVVIPLTFKASFFYSNFTGVGGWCTKHEHHFRSYSDKAPLYVILQKKLLNSRDPQRMLQFNMPKVGSGSQQYKDINDREINLKEFFNAHPQMEKLFVPMIFMSNNQDLIKKLGYGYQLIDELDPDMLGEELDFSNFNLNTLPESIGRFVKTKGLALSNNKLSKLPKSISKLVNLDSLDLQNNLFTEIPREVFSIENLGCIVLQNNKITEVTDADIDRFSHSSFYYISLLGNPLSEESKERIRVAKTKNEYGNGVWIHYDE